MSLQTVQDWFRHGPSPLPIDIVVPVSGGKDSQACLKLACQERDSGKRQHVIGLFNDTQFEHPWTYAHVERLSELYNVPIIKTEGSSVEREVLRYGRFPGGGARHCTSELKMNASKKFYRALSLYQRGFEVWYGVRSDESRERENDAIVIACVTNCTCPTRCFRAVIRNTLENSVFGLNCRSWIGRQTRCLNF